MNDYNDNYFIIYLLADGYYAILFKPNLNFYLVFLDIFNES